MYSMGEFRLEENEEMKDTRETETQEKAVVQKTGWCMCIILFVWDCFKTMGKGFQADNEVGHRRPSEKG